MPLHQEVYEALRQRILMGQLPAGTRVPSTRGLAEQMRVSRNTVLEAFDQLTAEGYVIGRHGSGTYVANALPEQLLNIRAKQNLEQVQPTRQSLSKRGLSIANAPRMPHHATRYGFHWLPNLSEFPRQLWGRMVARHARRIPKELFYYMGCAGHEPLRKAIAAYLGVTRGVRCSWEQVVITTGSQQSLDLTIRLLLDPGDQVWLEDPGYLGARGALLANAAKIIPVPVDHEGLSIREGVKRGKHARLAFVTPSCQFPLTVTMSLSRRLELLNWAHKKQAWILEDDYDSEFRYSSRPIPAIQGLDQHQRVIYTGTFSKIMFPALRLGYVIVPPDLVETFANARWVTDIRSPALEQAALTDFINEGHLQRHVRRLRIAYAERQSQLTTAIRRELNGLLEIQPAHAGMHLVAWLPPGADDQKMSAKAARAGIYAMPLSPFAINRPKRGALLLGFTGVTAGKMDQWVKELAAALKV